MKIQKNFCWGNRETGRVLTCFERLDGDRGRVVPQSLPDLSELSMSQTSLELEAASLDLPLVPRVVGEVGRRRFVNLREI